MKKIVAMICTILVVISVAAFANQHIVKIETKYEYDRGIVNAFTGKTTVHYDRVETKLFTGEVVDTYSGDMTVDYTAEMMVFSNSWTDNAIAIR